VVVRGAPSLGEPLSENSKRPELDRRTAKERGIEEYETTVNGDVVESHIAQDSEEKSLGQLKGSETRPPVPASTTSSAVSS
jgi:hypothetical protein